MENRNIPYSFLFFGCEGDSQKRIGIKFFKDNHWPCKPISFAEYLRPDIQSNPAPPNFSLIEKNQPILFP